MGFDYSIAKTWKLFRSDESRQAGITSKRLVFLRNKTHKGFSIPFKPKEGRDFVKARQDYLMTQQMAEALIESLLHRYAPDCLNNRLALEECLSKVCKNSRHPITTARHITMSWKPSKRATVFAALSFTLGVFLSYLSYLILSV